MRHYSNLKNNRRTGRFDRRVYEGNDFMLDEDDVIDPKDDKLNSSDDKLSDEDANDILNELLDAFDEDDEPEDDGMDLGDLDEGELFEDEDSDDDAEGEIPDDKMSDEKLKIEGLKIATNIAKLMSGVTTEDVINMAGIVADFIRNHEVGQQAAAQAEEEPEEDSDITADDLDLDSIDEPDTVETELDDLAGEEPGEEVQEEPEVSDEDETSDEETLNFNI